jgi:hypothetical protein
LDIKGGRKMIIMILLVILFIIGFIITRRHEYDEVDFFGIMMMLLSETAIIVCMIMIIYAHVSVEHKIAKDLMQYEGLCRRLEVIQSEYEDVSKSEVIKDVTEWNIEVYNSKYWANNPWTNWFYSRKRVEALQYIPLDTNTIE